MRAGPPRSRGIAFLHRFARHLRAIGITRTAGSLSFITLLGIVPLATVAFVSVARFPVFELWVGVLENFLLKHMVPATAHSMVHEYLREFIDNAAGLTGVSVLFLALTALLATATVEREINLIWGIRSRRPLGRRILVYALGLTAGPALVGASISGLTGLLARSVAALPLLEGWLDYSIRPLPLVVLTGVLAALYGVVPARRVPLKWALAGGFAAAVALEVAKEAFTFYVATVPTYKLVYGALAALPAFLLWVYLCWIIVLAGAAVTATLCDDLPEAGIRSAALPKGGRHARVGRHSRPERHR